MKKTLALVLALLMVLALVPTAFAAKEYKVTATVSLVNPYTSVEEYTGTFSATGTQPDVKVELPYDFIQDTDNGTVWNKYSKHITATVDGFTKMAGTDALFGGEAKSVEVTIKGVNTETYKWTTATGWKDSNGTKPTVAPFDGRTGVATVNAILPDDSSSTYGFTVTVTGYSKADFTGEAYTESAYFTISYRDTTKPVYDLKFTSCDNAVLKDGVWFVDTSKNTFTAETNPDDFTFGIAKNDGSKFNEEFYWQQTYGDSYPSTGNNNGIYAEKGITKITFPSQYNDTSVPRDGTISTAYVTVETEYAFYQGKVTIKYRTNVKRVDPKGVFFDKDEYTIGVNEVFTPSYTTTVPVWHDVASIVKLSQTAYTEKGIIDCDGNKITGLREGTAYIVLNYTDDDPDGLGTRVTYTDTAKVTVKGTYQVLEKANYIVTTSSSNLNVRSGAGTKYSKIGSLAKGTVVEVVEIKDGWAKIIFPSDKYTNGYVSAQYLTKQSTSPETVIGEKTVIARVLNVRSGAGTSYSIVGKLIRNTKVEVIETVANGSWSKIKFNGGYAYVSSTYIQ